MENIQWIAFQFVILASWAMCSNRSAKQANQNLPDEPEQESGSSLFFNQKVSHSSQALLESTVNILEFQQLPVPTGLKFQIYKPATWHSKFW